MTSDPWTVNSANPGGLYVSSGACLRTESTHVTGEDYADKTSVCDNTNYTSDPVYPDPFLNVPPSLDPMAYLPDPVVPATCDYGDGNQHQISADTTLDPSDPLVASVPGHLTFCKGLKVDNGAVVTLLPGIYHIKGELIVELSSSNASPILSRSFARPSCEGDP